MIDRRSFLKIVGAMTATALPVSSLALKPSRVDVRIVIIGAGVAGVRAAVRLKQAAPGTVITLIDPAGKGGSHSFAKINHTVMLDSAASVSICGIEVVMQRVVEVDPVGKRVHLQDGTSIEGDLLVLAPGVEFKHDSNRTHPLNEGLLLRRLEAMSQGDNVIVSIPRAPYQYPQGPYIATTNIAEYLYINKPGSKVIVLDHNPGSAMTGLFRRQWTRSVATSGIESVDASPGYIQAVNYKTGILETADGQINGGVIALMDEQRAAAVARNAGLCLQSDWCQVNEHTLVSLHYPDVYVPGDANDAAQNNKTAFTAMQQADAFVRAVADRIA